MGVDSNASSLAPTPVTAEQHHKPTLRESIANIFNKNQPPKETLVELATIDPNESAIADTPTETNIDNSPKTPEESITTDPQSETPHIDTAALKKEDIQQTAKDIEQVTQIIQQESTPKVEAVVENPKTLFPDSPPLYDKYHQAYEKEKKTIKGALTRSQDINVLRGRGKDRRDNRREVSELYDCLRSHGLSREQILVKGPDKKLLVWQDIQESTRHYINSHPDNYSYHPKDTTPFSFHVYDFICGINRLDSLGRFDPNFLDSPEKFNQMVRDAVSISDDRDFKENKDKFNQYTFLSKQDLIPLFVEGKYYGSSSDRFNALSSLQKKFFSTLENETKLNSYLDEHPEINKDIFSFICNRGRNGGRKSIIPFNQVLVDSDINPGEKIILPQECIYESGWYSNELQAFHSLDTREQQRFLSKQINLNDDPNKDLISLYFNKDKKPNSNFYKDFIVDSYNLEKIVTLPDGQVIDSTSDLSSEDFIKFLSSSSFSPEDKPFFDGILNLKGLDQEIVFFITSNKNKAAEYFDQNHQATSILFKDIAHEFGRTPWWRDTDKVKLSAKAFQKFFTSNLTSEYIQTFPSVEDQKFWNNVISLKDISIYDFQRLLGDNSYLNSEGKPTPEFLENFCKNGDLKSIPKFFTSNLTSEYIQTFPSVEDQKFWSQFINLKNQYSGIYQFMDRNRSQLDSLFTPDNHPNFSFFQEYVKYHPSSTSSDDPSKINWIISNITSESFTSPEDQKFWNNILKLKNLDDQSLETIFKSGADYSSFFNENSQPTAYLFEVLAIDGKINFLKSNLTSEIIQTFPSPEDQKYWKFLLEKNLSLEDNKKIISDITRMLIIKNKEQLAKDGSDIDFLNNLIGMFGKKNESIINGYLESLTSGIITKEDKPLVLEFLNDFSILSPNIIRSYKEAKQNHSEKLFISSLKKTSQKLISSQVVNETEHKSPYYQDLIRHVYSNNSGSWASYESNNSCSDRSSDLSQFNIRDVYQIDLLSQNDIKVKEGEQIDVGIQDRLEKPVLQVLENLKSINFDKEIGNQQLHQQADKLLNQFNLPDIDLSKLSLEDKLFIITSESIYHHQEISFDDIKNLLITYEFVNFEDIRNFIQGTNDKVSQASNQTYAHLCELNNFYSDRIKEVNKRIIESVSTNPIISKLLPSYFQSLSQENIQQSNQDNINKLQVDKLGLSKGFIDQITKTLQRRSPDKKYTPDQVKKMLHIYETVTQGLTESKSTSPNKTTQAFYGQFKSQREKTFALLNQLGNDYIDPRSIHLDEINLQQALSLNQSVENGNYNQDEFLTYTAQKFIDVFSNEKSQLDNELSKYVSENGDQRETLNAYITKNQPSANARMVGGVCVSGDNPINVHNQESKNNQWDMPNYFQMVFQDPKTSQCLGLCLLHHFEENGKKILAVSFNPSSTYLYSVDESSLFNGMLGSLQDFAQQNNFDIITTSQNKNIRTNRTGGLFEQTIDKKVFQINKTFSFSENKQFSYSPNYQIKDMDIVWERQK